MDNQGLIKQIKVCHVTSAHNRYDVRIFEKECTSLAKKGYDVTLIVNDNYDDETIGNVKIISTNYKYKNRIDRIFNSQKYILKKAIEVDADVYHLHDPELLIIGNKLKKTGKKVIFDSHEDVPAQIIDKQWIPQLLRSIISEIYGVYEKRSVKGYDAVISVTPHILERFEKINSNSIMITNYPIANKIQVRKDNYVNKICFAGGISEQWNHDKIINSIENIDGIEYILAGSGTKEYLNLLKSLSGWKKVKYVGKIPHDDVNDIYSESVAGMALNYSNQIKGTGTLGNTKIFEYMEAGLPVICTNYKLWEKIIDEYKCGICVNPSNVKEIRTAILFIINNKDKAVKMGQEGRRAIKEKFNWNIEEQKLLELYKALLN